MTETVALVVAAGRGQRFGGPLPKQYATLAGRPVLGHALARLIAHPRIDRVRAVIHPDDRPLYAHLRSSAQDDRHRLDPKRAFVCQSDRIDRCDAERWGKPTTYRVRVRLNQPL